MDILAILGAIISWGDKLIKALKFAFQRFQRGSMKNYKKRFEKGMQSILDNRDKTVKILYNYYTSTNTQHETVYSIRYLFRDGHSQDMPLITRPNLILTTNPEFNVESSYSGVVNHFSYPKTELTKAQKKWESTGIVAYEGHKYSLYKYDNSILEFRDTTFHTYRATFGEIYDEFVITLADKGIDKFMSIKRSKQSSMLPMRAKYLNSLDAILNLHERICAGGIITMLAARTTDDIAIVAQRRSATVSDEPNLLTLVPRAFHEALIAADQEFDLKNSIYRECYEELFGGEIDKGRHMEPDFYLSENMGIRELVEGQGTNHVLKPIALVWDLYRGNFIVAYCLYIRDQSWWSKYGRGMTLNWEYNETERYTAARASRSEVIRLLNRKDWAQDSYFAFVEGLRWLSTKEPLLESFNPELPKLILNRI